MSVFNIAHNDAPVDPPTEAPAPGDGEEPTTPEAPIATS